MNENSAPDGGQEARWNGPSGSAWVEARDLMDGMFRPLADLLAEGVESGDRVLDVGCGTGATTIAAARRAGPESECVGVDISAPMIAAARERAAREGSRASFVLADAQEHAFAPGSFDTIVSRFGVMFFEDPTRAFTNLRRAAADGARLRLIVWRAVEENPFMTTAERAAAPLLPDLPVRRPDEPGQFGLANPDLVHRILEDADWTDIDLQPFDEPCSFPEADLITYFTTFGPVGTLLRDHDATTRARVIESVRPAFTPYLHGTEVRFTAACHLITARKR
ncbi:methyltransferase family protein [Actinocorallia herbida]|uniref:Methyltransferase family protein n=1 Tax=Actinocorallia herbida TaxID=58109 RepID=A0A3N1D0R1_9ACTN|nr:class I SAM-dependent methyltransferase [Actinocorallia herbida]ROO87112.1 methyltransferase family protein [Actinocorallia herbida]